MKKTKYSNFQLIQRVAKYFRRYSHILVTDLFCAGLTTGAGIALPMILREIMNRSRAGTIDFMTIVKLGQIFVLFKLIEIVAGYYMTRFGHMMGAKIETDMRRDVFNHLHALSDSYFNNTKVGQIMARITSDLFDITEFAHHCPEEYAIGLLQILISFVILLRINGPLTVLIYAIIPIMIVSASTYNHRMRRTFKEQKNHIGDLNAQIEDSLLGVKVVKSFANEEIEIEKFEAGNQKFLGIKDMTYRNMAGFTTITRAFDGLMYLVVIAGGGFLLTRGYITSGDLVAYILFVQTLLTTVKRIVEFTEQFHRGMTGIERFVEIMDQDIEIFDAPDAVELTDVKGRVELQNVSFKYHKDEDIILKNINLTIEPGQSVALVGPSGGGKTTLCNLIPRFYDVDEGRILIDGKDIRTIKLKSLRREIGMVQQDVYLFSGTVFENITYGKPEATCEEVEQAAKWAGAYDFIMQLPKGFDTFVGERGLRLSGGQKQRISIARVFLKNPPILILDEATSALDNKSEHIVQKSLEKLSQGRSTLTIAHRLTTIQNADKIVVLTENGIVEQGDHESLLKQRGFYYRLYTQGGNLQTVDPSVLEEV